MAQTDVDMSLLVDKIALGELVSRYAWLVGQGRGSEVPALFCEDGVFEGRGHALHGRRAFEEFYNKATGNAGDVVPLVGNHLFEVDGDRATGVSTLNGFKRGTGLHIFSGFYSDDFVRMDGRWLFRRRVFTTYFDIASEH